MNEQKTISVQQNIKCSIIKDLLPSYLENICSQDTKNAVNEHLSECMECRRLIKMMRETDFTSIQSENAQIDYMKKIRHHFIKTGSLGGIILALIVILGIKSALYNYITDVTYFIFLPILLAATRILIPASASNDHRKRIHKVMDILSIIGICYGIGLTLFFLFHIEKWNAQGTWPFHLKTENIGPFLHNQYVVITIYQAAAYLSGLIHILREKYANFSSMSLYLTGGIMMLSIITQLKSLSDPQLSVNHILRTMVIILLEGIISSIFMHFIWKLKKDYKNK